MKMFNKNALCAAALAVALFGCKTVEEARVAQQPESQRPGERTVTVKELEIAPETLLNLAELEDIAVRYQSDVILAQENLISAEIALATANGEYLPTVNASFGHQRSTQNRDRHHQRSYTDGTWSGSMSMNWTIYDFKRTDLNVARCTENLRAAEQALRSAQSTAIYNVRKAFFELNRCIELDLVALESIEQYKEHFDQMKIKRQVGKCNEYDLIKAEVDWNTAVLSQIGTSHDVLNAWGELFYAMGLAEAPEFKLGQGSMREYELKLEPLMQLARKNEPTLASLVTKAKAASLYVDSTVAELYPTFSLDLGGSLSGNSLGLPLLWNLTGGASISQNIFAAGDNMRAIQEAVVQLRMARTRVSACEQLIFKQLRKAMLTAQQAAKQLEVATLTERQAKLNLNLVNEQFKVGKASSVERTDAQVSHSKAKAAVVTARFDKQEAYAAIAYIIGDFQLMGNKEK